MIIYQLTAKGETALGNLGRRYSRIVYANEPGEAEIEDFVTRVMELRSAHDLGNLDRIDSISVIELELRIEY